jgi:malate dehydrogenase (oxaloacetate-decarboxylating)
VSVDRQKALELHRRARGKVKTYPTINIRNEDDLAIAYAQGSVYPALEIQEDHDRTYEYTGRGNRLAIISDGTAVLGMGDIGPHAALPVMEGKSLLFKNFGDISAIPMCIETHKTDEIIEFARHIAPSFGAIDIEDISSPATFDIVKALQSIEIPVFSDDQQGTAAVVLAALTNALAVVGKKITEIKVVIQGAGAAGIAVADMLLYVGVPNVIVLNSKGILGANNPFMNHIQQNMSERTNPEKLRGGLEEAIKGSDVYVGLSSRGTLPPSFIKTMNKKPIIFALSMPTPEITWEEAEAAGASIIAMGLTTAAYNAMPNLYIYPGLVRGLLDVRATGLNKNILIAAAQAVASEVDKRRLNERHLLPDLFSDETAPRVAEAVAQAAITEGLARKPVPPKKIYDDTWQRLFGGYLLRM